MSGNGRSRRRPAARTSWDHLAGWYDGWVGNDGGRYHRAIAIPNLLELLELRPGERLLDVGCGQGVLAPSVSRAGAAYVGVDASPRMIDLARRRHGRDGRFTLADARNLRAFDGLGRGSAFHAAAFLLSLQDMEDHRAVIASVAAVLRPAARIVLLLTHPAFRAPRHSGWGTDPGRSLTYRRVDAYLREMAVPLAGRPGAGPSTSFHRPVSAYVNALAAEGFPVDAMRELSDPAGAEGNPDIPLFLAIRGRREPNRPRPTTEARAGPSRRR